MDNEENGTQTCEQYILQQYKELQEQNNNLKKINEQLTKDNNFLGSVLTFVNTKCDRQKTYLGDSMYIQYIIRFKYEGNTLSRVDDDTKAKLEALGFRDTDKISNF